MAILLDTDHISILQYREQPACDRLEKRLQAVPDEVARVSIVSFEEQARGWLAWIHRSKKSADLLKGYQFLLELLRYYNGIEVVPFESLALAEFQRLRALRIRIGTKDLRIAATALVHGVKLLSRNLRDFRQVPGLLCEDWTLP